MRKIFVYATLMVMLSVSVGAHVESTPLLHRMLHSIAPEYGHYWYSLTFYGILFYFFISIILAYSIYFLFHKLKIRKNRHKNKDFVLTK